MCESAVGLAKSRVERESALCRRPSFREDIVRARIAENSQRGIRIGEPSVGARKTGIPLDRLSEVL